jgi:hypothetical protein
MIGFFLLFVSTCLTICYSVVETSYNMMFGMTGLLVMSIFGGGSLISCSERMVSRKKRDIA